MKRHYLSRVFNLKLKALLENRKVELQDGRIESLD